MWAPSSYDKQKHPSGLISLVSFCRVEVRSGLKHGLLLAILDFVFSSAETVACIRYFALFTLVTLP